MIVLDINVVSEALKPQPNPAVQQWLNAQEPQTLFITAINWAELLSGVAVLPAGRKREALAQAMSNQVLPLFSGRLLAFDAKAAEVFAQTHADAQAKGQPISFADCAIAAIAQTHGYALATRNVRDFAGTELQLINPWVA